MEPEAYLLQRFGSPVRSEHPSLLHGDIWSGNVLCKGGEAVYIDPAIYYGNYEMELVFITLFTPSRSVFSMRMASIAKWIATSLQHAGIF